MKNKRIKVKINLPIETLVQLAIWSAELDKSVNWICEKALKEFIRRNKK